MFCSILKYCKTFKKFAKPEKTKTNNNNFFLMTSIHQYEMIYRKYIKLKFRRGFKCEMIYQKYIGGFKCDILEF